MLNLKNISQKNEIIVEIAPYTKAKRKSEKKYINNCAWCCVWCWSLEVLIETVNTVVYILHYLNI